MSYIDQTVESFVDFMLEKNAGMLSISELETRLRERFCTVPIIIIDDIQLREQNRDPKLENKIGGEYVYHKRFDLMEKLARTYESAKEEGRIKSSTSGAYEFEYALIGSTEVPDDLHIQAGGHLGDAFSCYQRAWWLNPVSRIMANGGFYIFVVGDKIPTEFQECTAVHEYVELSTGSHREATYQEFLNALHRGNNFLEKYTRWWGSHCKRTLEGLDQENKEALKEILPRLSVEILEQDCIL